MERLSFPYSLLDVGSSVIIKIILEIFSPEKNKSFHLLIQFKRFRKKKDPDVNQQKQVEKEQLTGNLRRYS